MKEWRVMLVLLAVVALLSTILGLEIKNNSPEKQLEEFKNSYNVISDIDNEINISENE